MKSNAARPVTKAIIPAAGHGTRLLPATKSQPKEMLPVGRKPVIQYVVEEIAAAQLRHVLVITSQQKRAIEDHFDPDPLLVECLEREHRSCDVLNHVQMDVEMFYTRQSTPKGLADAIGRGEHFVNSEPFLVCLGDSIIQSREPGEVLHRLIKTHRQTGAVATILFERVALDDAHRYGIAKPRGEAGPEFRVEQLVEKPTRGQAPSNLAIAGRYVFEPTVFDYIRRTSTGRSDEIQITDSMRLMIEDGLPVWGVTLGPNERRLDIGNHKSYFRAFFELSLADPEYGPGFRRYVAERLREATTGE